MSKSSPFVVEAVTCGVDWISASLRREEIDAQVWYRDAQEALYRVAEQGNKLESRKLLGFEGMACGNCFVGENDERLYAQFSGDNANMAYTYLDHPKANVSRLDIQATVKYDEEHQKEGRYQYAQAKRHNASLPTYRQRTVDIWIGSGGGDTVYIGAVSSGQRGRIYNKARESDLEQYIRSWRYEVVLRNEYALYMFRRICDKDSEAPAFIISQVVAWFAERGVSIRGLGHFKGDIAPTHRIRPTDVQRKLRWVEKQVIPTVRKLAELGYAEEVMDMLARALSANKHT